MLGRVEIGGWRFSLIGTARIGRLTGNESFGFVFRGNTVRVILGRFAGSPGSPGRPEALVSDVTACPPR